MKFTKMQGLGNDYLYVWGPPPTDAAALSVRLSDRHFGPGADGMIYIAPSNRADFRMWIFNADGSEAKMCGNGIRCVGKYVHDKGCTRKTRLTIETGAGLRSLTLHLEDGKVTAAAVANGLCDSDCDVSVRCAGGELIVHYSDETVTLTGDTRLVYTGEIEY